jgi:predicted nuclease of predicted toxin-antitoxin system
MVEGERGAADDAVLLKAKREERAIVTDDLDFGLLFERQGAPGPTVFLMRVGLLGRKARADRVLDVINSCAETPTGQLVVIEASQIRRRSFK